MSKVEKDIGSIVSWPPCIAARTERLDNQFNDGARSNRIVGSLRSENKESGVSWNDFRHWIQKTHESSDDSRIKNGSGRRVDIAGGLGEFR